MNATYRSHRYRLTRWAALTVTLLLLALILGGLNGLGRLDFVLHDALSWHITQPYPTPMLANEPTPPFSWITGIYNCIPVLLAFVAYLWLTPRHAFIAIIILFIMTLIGSAICLQRGLWLPPAAAGFTLMLSYPLWFWCRLDSTLRELIDKIQQIDNETRLFPNTASSESHAKRPNTTNEPLTNYVTSLEAITQRCQDLHHVIKDNLQQQPNAILVATLEGQVILTNRSAETYFLSLGIKNCRDALLPYLFGSMIHPQTEEHPTPFSWWNLLDLDQVQQMQNGIEVTDVMERSLIIKSTPCTNANQQHLGWIVAINDVSALRRAERTCHESLNFMSHDLRASQISILTLLELQQNPISALSPVEFLARIAKTTQTTLELTDKFLQLAQAEEHRSTFEVIDVDDIVVEACDQMWRLAKDKKITLSTHLLNEEALIQGDRTLMTQVISNLLSYSMQFCPENTTVNITLEKKMEFLNDRIVIIIADQGYGISWTDQSKLFQRTQRFIGVNQFKNDEVSLRLAFVKSVLDKHRATIRFTSKPNEGTTFTISIPTCTDDPT